MIVFLMTFFLQASGIGKAGLNFMHNYEVSIHQKHLHNMSTETYLRVQ